MKAAEARVTRSRGQKGPYAKECRQPIEAEKHKEEILAEVSRKAHFSVDTLILAPVRPILDF